MPDVKELRWYNLWRWILHTAVISRRTYEGSSRPWTRERLRALLHPSLDRPLFIVGAPRSGTTFLGSCIARLPEVSYHFEPILTKAAARYVYERRWPRARARRIYRMTYAGLLRLVGDPDLRFAEKTPRNCFIMPFLAETFPGAQFVHILRDGRDAALSRREKQWVRTQQDEAVRYEPGGYPYGPYARFWIERDRVAEYERTSDLHRCIWDWRRHVEAARAAGSDLPDAQYLEVRYETMMHAPAEEGDRILSFLSIVDLPSRTAFLQALAEGHTDSIGRWRASLDEDERNVIDREAGAVLRELGYA